MNRKQNAMDIFVGVDNKEKWMDGGRKVEWSVQFLYYYIYEVTLEGVNGIKIPS